MPRGTGHGGEARLPARSSARTILQDAEYQARRQLSALSRSPAPCCYTLYTVYYYIAYCIVYAELAQFLWRLRLLSICAVTI
jgi:hypothetical protein